MARMAGPTAALAGVPSGIRAEGSWIGRRQLFIRFAGEAETATMFTAQALGRELTRLAGRSRFHSVAITGRDTLGNAPFIREALDDWEHPLPVLLETNGQRPEALAELKDRLALLEVVLDPAEADAVVDRALATLVAAAKMDCPHGLILAPKDGASDAQLLRIVEQVHEASDGTMIVVHPPAGSEPSVSDRRWHVFLEQAVAVHDDVRLLLRLFPPLGLR